MATRTRAILPDPARILGAVDLPRNKASKVVAVGLGTQVDTLYTLAKLGVEEFIGIDFDHVSATNVWSQYYGCQDIGKAKVDALEARLKDINPNIRFRGLRADFLKLSERELAEVMDGAGLFLMGTDNFIAQARGNLVSLKYQVPTVFRIVYTGGGMVEVTWNLFEPPSDQHRYACHRCNTQDRYGAYSRGFRDTVGAAGSTILSSAALNLAAGLICLAILQRGTTTPFGDWLDRLGSRTFLQLRVFPGASVEAADGPRDVFARYLGSNEHRFSLDSIWLPPDNPPKYDRCPDCHSTGDLRDARKWITSTMPIHDSGEMMVQDGGERP